MARKGKRKSGRKSKKLSITGAIPIGYLALEGYTGYQAGGVRKMADNLVGRTTGYIPSEHRWDGASLLPLGAIIISGYAVRKIANRAAPGAFMGLPLRW